MRPEDVISELPPEYSDWTCAKTAVSRGMSPMQVICTIALYRCPVIWSEEFTAAGGPESSVPAEVLERRVARRHNKHDEKDKRVQRCVFLDTAGEVIPSSATSGHIARCDLRTVPPR
ncbi:hypothetical protein Kisp02_53430 [Kineosporia sp. NBRC 101731]|nr:hypothetical protein Kisp02_53430 [Kineosporia sp. NBRC 101731]